MGKSQHGGKRPGAGRPTKEKANSKVEKSRYWAFCVYPESEVAGWRDILRRNAVACAIGPLHDRDVYEKDVFSEDGWLEHKKGDPVKPHFHILMAYEGPTTSSNVLKLSERCGGTKFAEKVSSCKGYYEYLSHKNEHDKAQYDEADIVTLCGFNIADYGLSTAEVDRIIEGLEVLIEEKGWREYKSLMTYLRVNGMGPERRVARCQTFYFREIFAGIRREAEQVTQRVNPVTGEVMG